MWLHTVLFKPKTYKIWQTLPKMMQIQGTQVKNKRIEMMTYSKQQPLNPNYTAK